MHVTAATQSVKLPHMLVCVVVGSAAVQLKLFVGLLRTRRVQNEFGACRAWRCRVLHIAVIVFDFELVVSLCPRCGYVTTNSL